VHKLAPALLLLVFAATVGAQSFNLAASNHSVVSLNGKWRFHPGSDARWSDPAFDDSSWPLLSSTRSWSDQGYKNMSGDAWYRFTVQAPAAGGPLSLMLAPILTSYQVYVDGRPIGGFGKMAPGSFIYQPRLESYALNAGASTTPRTLHIALHVWHDPVWAKYEGGGPLGGGSMIGDAGLIANRQLLALSNLQNANMDLCVSAILRVLIGFVILGLFLLRRSEHEYLWFAATQLFGGADDVLSFVHVAYGSVTIESRDLLDTAFSAGFWIAGMLLVASILRPRRGLWFRIALILAMLSPLTVPPYWFEWISVPLSSTLGTAMVIPAQVWTMAVLLRRAWRHDPDAMLLAAPVVLVDGYYLAANALVVIYQLGWLPVMFDLSNYRFPLKPFDVGLYSIFNIIYLLALMAFLIRRFTLALRREETLQSQLEAASQVQKMLVPESAPKLPGFTIEAVYLPAEMVGGDFFQQVPDRNGGLLLVVGDVAGKGLPAAMMVSMLVGAIRAECGHTSDPALLMTALNERMIERSRGGFATCLAMHVDGAGVCRIANAGHLAPYVDGVEWPLAPSLPLGVVSGIEFETSTRKLEPGASLALISDGVVEARNASGELFGFERTAAISTESAENIARVASTFGQEDDITVLTVAFHPA
jgi:phosphoserine phosphatase RsbU/P